MSNYLIIGGGLTGVLLGNILHRRGVSFQGLEKSRQLGSQSNFKQWRLYNDTSVGFLNDICDSVGWDKVDDQPKERKKGEWTNISSEFIDEELAFLGNPVYQPKESFDNIFERLRNPIQDYFTKEKTVEKIDLDRKVVTCIDGTEFPYEILVWCADLRGLLKVTQSAPKNIGKTQKKKEDHQGGIHLEMELSQPLIPFANSVVFPFRYKEFKLRAIGLNDSSTQQGAGPIKMHWIVFIERELAEDREEVAKVIRALKRELQKEFPELKTLGLKEKIVFEPSVESYTPTEIKGLELFPSVFYVGSQGQLPDTSVKSSPLDLTIENCKRFDSAVLNRG